MVIRNKILVALSVSIAAIIGFIWLYPQQSTPPPKKIVSQEPLKVPIPQPEKPEAKTLIYHYKAEPVPAPARKRPPQSSKTIVANPDIISKLEQQGLARENAMQLRTEQYAIPDDVFEHMSKASNWMPELQKAASSIIVGKNGEPSMLRVYDVADDSILREFGIQDGDIIALIDGEMPVFSPSKAVEYTQKAYNLITDLQNGKPVSITVLRNGRPVNLEYQKW